MLSGRNRDDMFKLCRHLFAERSQTFQTRTAVGPGYNAAACMRRIADASARRWQARMSHGADHAARSSGGHARITKWGNLFSYFPCSGSKFPAPAKQIPCFLSAGIRLEILGLTPDFAAISSSGRQQSTISLHNSLFPGIDDAAPE
jgi:hypothetical protein